MARLTANEWSRYWEKGTLTTFLGRFKNNYDGEVEKFWKENLENTLPQSKIIDLATGNGALAILISELLLRKKINVEIDAIDFSTIDPKSIAHRNINNDILNKITFHSNKPIESTTFPDNTFDIAVSQFGFEYGDPEASVAELNRILKQSSKIFFLMHHKDSAIIKQAQEGVKQTEHCLSLELHQFVRKLLYRMEKLSQQNKDPAKDAKLENLREKINQITGSIHDQFDSHNDPTQAMFFLKNTMAVFSPKMAKLNAKEKIVFLENIKEECSSYVTRMYDLISAARSDDEIKLMRNSFEALGFKIENGEIFEFEKQHFGYSLSLSR